MRLRPDDLALAGAVALVQLVGTALAAQHTDSQRGLGLLSTALLLAGPAALLVRRQLPELPLAVAVAATYAWSVLGLPDGPAFVAYVVALVSAAALGRRTAALGSVAALATAVLLGAAVSDAVRVGPALSGVAWSLALVLLADRVRARRLEHVAQARAREQEQQRRAAEERLLVARELHDVLAHSISLISVQAGVALHLLDEHPEQARTALTTIRQASADGLRDLRRTLAVLREEPQRAPTPGLDDLDRLVAGARAAGLEVSAEVRGTPRPVDGPVGLAAYRVVQEALTNVSRHAGSPRARVVVTYGDEALDVSVDDDGPSRSAGGEGHGLRGMAERAGALGGTLAAGARPDGGFSVHAHLPA